MTVISLALVIITTAVPVAGKIHPATRELGLRDNGHIHAWVFFSHKPRGLARSAVAHRASDKALERRRLRGNVPEEQVEDLDRTVSPGFLQEVQNTGATIRQVSRWLNAVSVSATRRQLELLTQLSFVSRIEPVRRVVRPPLLAATPFDSPPTMLKSNTHLLDYGPAYNQLAQMNVPAVHEMGYSGKDIIVLMLDTGFYQDHESIQPGRILAEYDFLYGDGETQNETAAEDSSGQHNHGTHTYTALGGYSPGQLIGPAYQCNFLLAKTESAREEFQGEEDNYVAGLEWGEALGADIVSSSLGYVNWYTYEDLNGLTAVTTRAVLWAARLGMLVVTAAGNRRQDLTWGGYIIAPADADSIIAVGAVDENGTLTSFSSHGPTADGRTKPDVVAQGVNVRCGSPMAANAYTSANGTSLSTPLVVGCAALLLEAHPDWQPEDVRNALRATASRVDRPDYDYGYGLINVLEAMNYYGRKPSSQHIIGIGNIYPNPFPAGNKAFMLIPLQVPAENPVSLDMVNILGRHVAHLYRRNAYGSKPPFAVWDGFDDQGFRVPSGLYFVKLSAGSETIARKIIVRH
ncbi:MAG: S8 family peptidase [Fidelibacterota bacterium]|nr:MAG: S8 family peptidase [Candidatus Neomarinimicrobiota bacterium]